MSEETQLFNKVVNDILLQVKPVYLRKQIATEMLDLINNLQKEKPRPKKILANRVYADATLMSMTKAELIEHIRILEHNWAATEEALNNSAANSEKIFYEQKAEIDKLKEQNMGLHLDKQELMNELSEHKNAYARLDEAYDNLQDRLTEENKQLSGIVDHATKALHGKAVARQQYITKLKEAFDSSCCEIKPNHGCSCSCEACLASTAADVLDGILEGRTKEIFEKTDSIMNCYCWGFNRVQDTALGKRILDLAKEYGVNLNR